MGIWALAERQHGVVARAQLLDLGMHPDAVKHRIATGRLHPVHRGVYAVGRPQLSRRGHWMAAILACGAAAVLSHGSAAALWSIEDLRASPIHVSAPTDRRRPGIVIHRRGVLGATERTERDRIPVTTPVCTLIDCAAHSTAARIQRAIGEADKLDLVDPETLRAALDTVPPRPGVGILRAILDRETFALTDSRLESRFLAIARAAGLPLPETRLRPNGHRVDFLWAGLGLIVETDGLRYHRTPGQQAVDRRRDQEHAVAGLTTLRFTHAQGRHEPAYVAATLQAVAGRLAAQPSQPSQPSHPPVSPL